MIEPDTDAPAFVPAPKPKRVRKPAKAKTTKKAKKVRKKTSRKAKAPRKRKAKPGRRAIGRPKAGREKRYRPSDTLQTTIYVPAGILARLRRMTDKAKTDRSTYLTALIGGHVKAGKLLKIKA